MFRRPFLVIVSLSMILVLFLNCGNEALEANLTETREEDSLVYAFSSDGNAIDDPEISDEALVQKSQMLNAAVRKPIYKPALGHHGATYFYLGGPRGVVMCLHGTNGSASGWTSNPQKKVFLKTLASAGYSFICPTSLNRTTEQWDPSLRQNRDVRNLEALLRTLRVRRNLPIFMVGHSNGGGFASRLYMLSEEFGNRTRAIQYSNAAGILQLLGHRNYEVPSVFAYANCDPKVDHRKVTQSIHLLQKRRIANYPMRLDLLYKIGNFKHCHEFMNTAARTLRVFNFEARPKRGSSVLPWSLQDRVPGTRR